jgi:uncharacterized protein (DUF1810 family)
MNADARADPFDLQRFIDAQEPVYAQVLGELAAGAKTSHWMWFVFPQLRALGRSATAQHYGLASRAEAQAYWRHPVLGPRLEACSTRVAQHAGRRSAVHIFGTIDAMKLRSCMTLFEAVVAGEPAPVPVFARMLDAFYAGQRDPLTLSLL